MQNGPLVKILQIFFEGEDSNSLPHQRPTSSSVSPISSNSFFRNRAKPHQSIRLGKRAARQLLWKQKKRCTTWYSGITIHIHYIYTFYNIPRFKRKVLARFIRISLMWPAVRVSQFVLKRVYIRDLPYMILGIFCKSTCLKHSKTRHKTGPETNENTGNTLPPHCRKPQTHDIPWSWACRTLVK